jgi:hypothetical protein
MKDLEKRDLLGRHGVAQKESKPVVPVASRLAVDGRIAGFSHALHNLRR